MDDIKERIHGLISKYHDQRSSLIDNFDIVAEGKQVDYWILFGAEMGLEKLLLEMNTIFWSCMCCSRKRPDKYISVKKHVTERYEDGTPLCTINVKYCNDDRLCKSMAFNADWRNWRNIKRKS